MYIRLKQDTTVPLAHPYRVPLPNWGLIAEDPISETMIVEVPEEDLPMGWLDDEQPTVTITYRGPVMTHISDQQHLAWQVHLDAKYLEHHGDFRPVVV